jgi:hypothetical protein
MSVANLKTKIMITAEEFFRNKIKELHPNKEVVTLSQELITAEQGLRWAHEFKQLHLHDVSRRSEQLLCDDCKRDEAVYSTNIGKYCRSCKPF